MEQTKAKTALLFLSCKLDIPFGLIDDSASMRVSDTLRCISDLQTRIANLEAQNKELRKGLRGIQFQCLRTHESKQTSDLKNILSRATETLKEDNKDG